MAFTYETKITWDHDMSLDTAFQTATDPVIDQYVAEGKSATPNALDISVSGGQWTYFRLWVDQPSAQAWVDYVSTFPGYISAQVAPVL